jgi:hypothetical protein
MNNREAYEICAARMDAWEAGLNKIREYVKIHGKPPAEYKGNWDKLKDEKPWRKDARIIAQLKKTARIMAKNENKKAGK